MSPGMPAVTGALENTASPLLPGKAAAAAAAAAVAPAKSHSAAFAVDDGLVMSATTTTVPNLSSYTSTITTRRADGFDDTAPMSMVAAVMRRHITSIDKSKIDCESSFFVADLGEVYRQHMRWKRLLPRVEPFYAVKCNPDPHVIRLLSLLNTGFDCASHAEMEQVLGMDISPDRIIYANPCKAASHIAYARDHSVSKMTFDNAEELYKIKENFPDARLFLRILTDDSNSLCRLGLKFGADLDVTSELLKLARQLGLHVEGVSFHVGSGSYDPNAFDDAIRRARFVFDQAEALGMSLKTLDIGGGFTNESFDLVAPRLAEAIDDNFPANVRVIAEPGRYYVGTSFTLATHIIARRSVPPSAPTGRPKFLYYLNDGVYGSFNCIMFDHQHPQAQVLTQNGCFVMNEPVPDAMLSTEGYECSLWGPTCDSADCISADYVLPARLQVGDWLYFRNMGAYTNAAASKFNGFPRSPVHYVVSELGAFELLNI